MKETQSLGQELGTVVFIDIVGFSRMLMDSQVDVFSSFLRTAERSALANEASRLLTVGDGMVLLFPTPTQAIKFAVRIHHDIRQVNLERASGDKIEIRVGVATGEIMTLENTIVGSTVNFAQRIMSRAEAGQTLCDEATKVLAAEYLSKESAGIKSSFLGKVTLKHMVELPLYSLSPS
jgi:class 3 adenylate cyclase